MSKYNKITEGMTIANISEAEGGYNYYGYIRTNGEWAIMRENTAQTEYKFKIGASDYETAWTNRQDHTYKLPIVS